MTSPDREPRRTAFLEGLWAGWASGRAGEQMDDDYAQRSWRASDAAHDVGPGWEAFLIRGFLVGAAAASVCALIIIACMLRVIAGQALLANCIALADRGIVCEAAGGDRPHPNAGGTI